MMKICFLSCDSLAGYVVDDGILKAQLESEGHSVATVSWSKKTDWSAFDCVVIRTTWDYMERPKEFFATLREISQATRLFNDLKTIEWNIHKKYLSSLEKKGVTIVPTIFFAHGESPEIPESWGEKIVIKPAISAGSYKTTVTTKKAVSDGSALRGLSPGDWMCQPFLQQIQDGEISLIYFQKTFSHALLKIPKAGDFRVQEEFGGDVRPLTPSAQLMELGATVVNSVPAELLYARVDVVPYHGHFALMELELIEPSLYFRSSDEAAKNFSKALTHAKW